MYEFRLALRSIKGSPALSGLIMAAIGLGIGVFMILLTAYHLLERDPLPAKSGQVYRVMVDSWGNDSPYAGGMWGGHALPQLMTYTDAMNLMNSGIPTHQAAMFRSRMYLKRPDDERPFQVSTRVTFRGFFAMFNAPFQYGAAWDAAADDAPQNVIVLSHATNQRLFGGTNSVGKPVDLDNRTFRVVGVLDKWAPMPLFYNVLTLTLGVGPPEDVYIPFHFLERYQLANDGADMGWKNYDPGFENMLQSESVWLQFWAELDTPAQKASYENYLHNYAREQRDLGRFPRSLDHNLYNVTDWIGVVTRPLHGPSLAFLVLGFLFLAVCLVNLVSMLLGKFVGRMQEISIRRALGATRRSVFTQHLYEVSLLGIGGGLLGLLASQLILLVVRIRFDLAPELFTLDPFLLVFALALSLFSGIGAGLIPAWRACSTPPVTYLKSE